jgi:superfamily II DNA or RNA helicase
MSKAVISNRIYLTCEEDSPLHKLLRDELVHSINQMPVSKYPLVINNITRVTDTIISIPSGRTDLIPAECTIIDKRSKPSVVIPKPSFDPREDQQKAIDFIETSGLVNAKPGWGKTIAGLGIAHKFQQKTLIVTTTTIIRDMWVKEVEKWFGIKCGIIGGGKMDYDAPITIANIQTLRKHALKLSGEFGLIIVDEVHRSPAKTFTDTINAFRAEHKVGLSGTLLRKDGLHCVLPDYFSKNVFIGKDENRMEPVVHLWSSTSAISSNEFIPWANQINKLYSKSSYKQEILNLANMYMDTGYKILVLFDRTFILEELHKLTEDRTLLITGSIGDRNAILAEMDSKNSVARGLWGTQSIFSEGFSVSELSCVILATPISNDPLLEQIIGRIQRQAEGKKTPVVVDISLGGSTGTRQKNTRKRFYVEKGWTIKSMGNIQ